MTTALWGIAAMLAMLWPDHVSGPLDGMPLDGVVEAILIGFIVPALWWFHPRFLRTTLARACIIALIVWKISSTLLFAQDGWCVRFEPERPLAKDAGPVPHSWDLRADWRRFVPACSAVMTRSYHDPYEFPAWFFNLPPPNESWPVPEDRPPLARVGLRVSGYLHARAPGLLQLETGPHITGALTIDGEGVQGTFPVSAGTHQVAFDGLLTNYAWSLVPRWNGDELWNPPSRLRRFGAAAAIATMRRPSPLDIAVRPWIRWIPTVTILVLISAWTISALARTADWALLAWTAGMSLVTGGLRYAGKPELAAWALAALAAAAFLPVPPRHRNMRGAFLLVGIPWLAFVLMNGFPDIGRGRLYTAGDDFWMYQRYAYRIVMQGYWLEGGSTTFYFQPFYRWIVALLHSVFGDSSVGESFWDGFALLAGAMLSFRITRAFAGFRWGVVAAVAPLTVFALGTARYLMGYGLGEVSSAGLLSIAGLCAIGARRLGWAAAVAAGVLATLAFYTRLNNGIMACGIALFALSPRVAVRDLVRPACFWPRIAWHVVFGVGGTIALGLLFFAWRTYHYTGVFSVFYGTQRYIVTIWRPDTPLSASLARLAESVTKVLTVNDPPRFDVYALPVMAGALVAVASALGTPRLRDLPAFAVLFFFASIASAFIVYGWVYAGRFSIHMLPITCALSTCAAARLWGRSVRHPSTHAVVPRGRHVV